MGSALCPNIAMQRVYKILLRFQNKILLLIIFYFHILHLFIIICKIIIKKNIFFERKNNFIDLNLK